MDPSHAYCLAHTIDTCHPRALFPALATPDSRPTVGILALQGDVHEYSLAFETAGARPVVVRRAADLSEAPGHRSDDLVIPGGESTIINTLLVAFEIFMPLCKFIGAGLPACGSCVGMIMLADRVEGAQGDQAFLGGINMTVRHDISGRQVNSYEEDFIVPEFGTGPDRPLRAVFIQAPWVEEVSPGVETLTTTCTGRVAGVGRADGGRVVVIRQGSLLVVSFHPEVRGDRRVRDVFAFMVTRRA